LNERIPVIKIGVMCCYCPQSRRRTIFNGFGLSSSVCCSCASPVSNINNSRSNLSNNPIYRGNGMKVKTLLGLIASLSAFNIANKTKAQDRFWTILPQPVTMPQALLIDSRDNLYVADWTGGGRVLEKTAKGEWITLATYGKGIGQVDHPYLLKKYDFYYGHPIYSDDLLVTDEVGLYTGSDPSLNNLFCGRQQQYHSQGYWTFVIFPPFPPVKLNPGTDGTRPSSLCFEWSFLTNPIGIAKDLHGNTYISDSVDGGRIQRVDRDGKTTIIASYGSSVGQVASPGGIALDSNDDLYVADTGNNRIQKFAPTRVEDLPEIMDNIGWPTAARLQRLWQSRLIREANIGDNTGLTPTIEQRTSSRSTGQWFNTC
jgi:DNA-binding beta-propeller fold protein YncE